MPPAQIFNNINNPSIVEIKSLEKEVQMLLAQYNDATISPVKNINNITNMMNINNKIKALLNIIQYKIKAIYPHGITNQSSVTMNNADLIKIANKLQEDENKLQTSIDQYNSLEGENSVLKIQMKTHYYEYMFYIIVCIIISIYVLKVYSIPQENVSIYSIENLLLIIAILLLIYNSYTYILDKLTKIIEYSSQKTNDFYHLL
jgi:hypothetical protein